MPFQPTKNHRCFLLLFLPFFSLIATAQSKVTGTITTGLQQPLSNATVLLQKAADSSLLKGVFTQKNGGFVFEDVPSGAYFISVSFSGMRDLFTPLFQLNEKEVQHLGNLQLEPQDGSLQAVVLTAKKPMFEQKIDRMVINVASTISNAGSTALDVLMRSPGIVVDLQNNNLTMNGKDGVFVMMNGKISRMPVSAMIQLLAGMNASNIERIELITTPPSNFDAEGNAGFINIVLKTNTQFGTNGSYSFTAGYGKKPLGAASINFNHRKGRVNLFGDYSFSKEKIIQEMALDRTVLQGNRTIGTFSNTERDTRRRNHNARLGIDIELSKKTTIGLLGTYLSNLFSMDAVNRSHIFLNKVLDTVITIDNSEEHPLTNYSTNFNVSHNFSQRQRLTFNADYVYYKDENTVNYLNHYEKGDGSFLRDEPMNSLKSTPIRFWVSSADYNLQLNDKVNMEAGVKSTISRFVNDVLVERETQNQWTADPNLTAKYNLREHINAAYAAFNLRLGTKTNAKAGLRYEYTVSNLGSQTVKNIVDRRYGNLFPSFFLSQGLSETQSMNFSYSRRITRPTFNDMAPFVYFVDPNTYFSGNPALQPSVSDAVKMDYLIKQLVFSFSYTHQQNPITNFAPRIDAVTNKQTLAAENQKNQHVLAFTVSLPWKVTSWWNMQTNLTATRTTLNGFYQGEAIQIGQQNLVLNSTQTFTLPKDFSFELRGLYLSGGLFGIYKIKAVNAVDIGLQKKFAASRSNLRFAVSNIFGPPLFRPSVNLPERNLLMNGRLQFTNTLFRLTFTRSFGNDKVQEKRSRTTASEEERQRVNTN
jgi:hypothetical protein